MEKFLRLYEEENQEESLLTIDKFNETIEKLKEVFNNSEPVQTAGVLLLDIISKIVNDSDNQQDLIDSFQQQIEDALQTAEQDLGSDGLEGDENDMNYDEMFQDMNDDEFNEVGDVEGEQVEDEGFVLDDTEKNSKEEKFSNIKELLNPDEKSKKSKKEDTEEDEEKETKKSKKDEDKE